MFHHYSDLAVWLKSTGAWVTLLLGDLEVDGSGADVAASLGTPLPEAHAKATYYGSALVR